MHRYLPTFTYTWAQINQHDHQDTDHKGGIHPTLLYQSENWTLTRKERQMLTTSEMRCLREAAGNTRMDKIRNEEIRRRVNMQPAEQTANKNKIRWWPHVKRMAPTAPQSKALVIHPEGRRPRGRPRNRWEDDVPRWYKEIGISMTDVNNWVKERRPMVHPLDDDGRSVTPQDVILTQDVIIAARCNTIYARCNNYAKCNNFYARCNKN